MGYALGVAVLVVSLVLYLAWPQDGARHGGPRGGDAHAHEGLERNQGSRDERRRVHADRTTAVRETLSNRGGGTVRGSAVPPRRRGVVQR